MGEEPVKWISSCSSQDECTVHLQRLCLALLVRGATRHSLQSFISYHFAIGFSRIVLLFDAPEDPAEAEALETARSYGVQASGFGPQEVVVHCCTSDWFQKELKASRFFRKKDLYPSCQEMVTLFDEVHD
eukprot:4616219-Amphidinium_carterae.1